MQDAFEIGCRNATSRNGNDVMCGLRRHLRITDHSEALGNVESDCPSTDPPPNRDAAPAVGLSPGSRLESDAVLELSKTLDQVDSKSRFNIRLGKRITMGASLCMPSLTGLAPYDIRVPDDREEEPSKPRQEGLSKACHAGSGMAASRR